MCKERDEYPPEVVYNVAGITFVLAIGVAAGVLVSMLIEWVL
jgi:hypothetical protein